MDNRGLQPATRLFDETVEGIERAVGIGGQDETTARLLQTAEINEYLRSVISPETAGVRNVALMDWTSLYHVEQLCTHELEGVDPFVSIADLNALLCAVTFYDRIITINASRVNREIGITFGISDILSDLYVEKSKEADAGEISLGTILDRCFLASWHEFESIDHNDPPPWFGVLQQSWQQLLPHAQIPASRNLRDLDWEWSSSRPYALNQLFHAQSGTKWHMRSDEGLRSLVLDNDARGLTYEHIADTLTSAVSGADGRGPIVRYVGGVLRSPMQKAMRTRWADMWSDRGAPPAEATLNEYWQRHWQAAGGPQPIFPFWLSAIIAGCRTKSDLRTSLQRWREKSEGFRRRRADLEAAMLRGDAAALADGQRALAGEVEKLKEGVFASTAVSGATAAAQALAVTHLPPPLPQVTKALAGPSKSLISPLTMLILRATKPHLWFLAKSGAAASTVLKPQADLFRIFDLKALDASAGSTFLGQVNTVEWAV